MATQLGEALEIYNLKTQTHNVMYGPAGEPQFIAKGGEGFLTGIKGFVDIQVTDDHSSEYRGKSLSFKRFHHLLRLHRSDLQLERVATGRKRNGHGQLQSGTAGRVLPNDGDLWEYPE